MSDKDIEQWEMNFLCDECGTLTKFNMNEFIKGLVKDLGDRFVKNMIELKALVKTLQIEVDDLGGEIEKLKNRGKIK